MSSRGVLVLAAAVALLALPAAARADGDPASDFLLTQDSFVPSDANVPAATIASLNTLLQDARNKNYRMKVALIASPTDLGAVTPLWRQPQRYAEFLGQELFYVYKGRLLIVMPNGYGIYQIRKPVDKERAVLDRLPHPEKSGVNLGDAAITAVEKMAAAHGITLSAPTDKTDSKSGGGNGSRLDIYLIVAVAAVLVALVVIRPRRRRRAK
ncbi:MAG TPA: hypothetical protein VGF23_05870 [Gaiellaceae bacterium]|jgi:hypothetical protein